MRPQDVQYWDEWKEELTQPQRSKARKFKENIEYQGDSKFVAMPISGYNSTPHVMETHPVYGWRCSCQGFNSKAKKHESGELLTRPFCSHLMALMLCFSCKKFDRWHVRLKEGDFE